MQKGGEAKLAATADALKKLGSVSDFKYHKHSSEEVLDMLSSNIENGLSEEQAEKNSEKYRTNELEAEVEKSLWERIKE